MIRRISTIVHRYVGLYLAAFLIIAGLTGTILAFDKEINEWLVPERTHVPVQNRPQLDPFTLRERAQALHPHDSFYYLEMNKDPGDIFAFLPSPRTNPATSKPYDQDCELLYLNPYTGEETACDKGEGPWPITRANFIFDVYALHASLLLGQTGHWLFGTAALIWTFDCFISFYLTLPASRGPFWKRWGKAWWVKWRANAFRINFDLHRAAGLWTWIMLFIFAISTVSFRLPQVYNPVIHYLFPMPDDPDIPSLPQPLLEPAMGWRQGAIVGEQLAAEQARLHGFKLKKAHGDLYFLYNPDTGVFTYSAHGDRDVGYHAPAVTVQFDGKTGELRSAHFASGENAGVTFTNWISAIHARTVGGMAMQVLVGVMGIVIAMLSVTGVYIWWKKLAARRGTKKRSRLAAASAATM